jgi:hypothetical protein
MNIPTIAATLTKSGRQLTFYCKHCRCWHFHSAGDDAAGHRVAHCWRENSPYKDTGYYLTLEEEAANATA